VTGIHRSLWLLPLVLLAPGCRRGDSTYYDPATGRKMTRIVLQTDWYAEAEHGGFYQAVAKGYYRDVGLDVTIDQGGPMIPIGLKTAIGVVQFAITRADESIVAVSRGIPYVIVGAMMQHDPQALLLHESNPVNTFRDLSGKTVMTVPGSKWVLYIQKVYNVRFSIIPLNFGMAQFMADPNFIQQCFVTNEPYYVEKNGGHPKTIMISSTGFDPYRVIEGNADFVATHPRETRAFVEASMRGWRDYLYGDPTPANREISRLNIQMKPDFLAYALRTMKRYRLVEGDPAKGEALGLVTRKRLQEQIDALQTIGALDHVVTPDDVADFKDMPAP
jgi:NitT/TauT family transport system substrate-binding protein